jgi:metal-dependent amidase/aminoacylase/carboxypeptidase family protein
MWSSITFFQFLILILIKFLFLFREDGYPSIINHQKETENVLRVANKAGFITKELRIMASEDFSYYLLKTPGNFFSIGGIFKEFIPFFWINISHVNMMIILFIFLIHIT